MPIDTAPPSAPWRRQEQKRRRQWGWSKETTAYAYAAAAATYGRLVAHGFLAPLFAEFELFLVPRSHLYAPVKGAILADGYAPAAVFMLSAVLVNHIRRVLSPWLGQFLWWHPVGAMRLARATPHYFVEEQLSSVPTNDGEALCIWALQVAALAATRALLRHRLLGYAATTTKTELQHRKGNEGAGTGNGGGGTGFRRDGTTEASSATWHADVCRVLYLALCLMHVEYAYAEACWAMSWIYASTYVYLRGTTAERQFTHGLLMGRNNAAKPDHTDKVPSLLAHCLGLVLIIGLLVSWLWRAAVRPIRRHGAVGVAVSGLAVLGAFIGLGTVHLVRYSNKYFIWLEMSEMLLTWVWIVLAIGVVSAWRLCAG